MDQETKYLCETTEGQLHPTEPEVLYELGKKCTGKGVIVEIGSWKGRSTLLLARGSLHNSKTKIYAVDTFEATNAYKKVISKKGRVIPIRVNKKVNTLKEFKKNIERAGVTKLVSPLIGWSSEVSKKFDEPIEILFIDGSHDYKSVIQDIDSWDNKLISGGWIAFHDTDYPGVMRAFKERIFNSDKYSNLGFCGSIIYAQKISGSKLKKEFTFRLRNFLTFIWKDIPESLKEKIRLIMKKQYYSNFK